MQRLIEVIVGLALALGFAYVLVTKPGGWLGWVGVGALLLFWIVGIVHVVEGARGFWRGFRRGWGEKA